MYNDLLYEYELTLLDKKKALPSYLFATKPEDNEKKAIELLKFVIKNYLRWSPQQVVDYLDWNILTLMHLDSVVKYIKVPIEIYEKDYMYIVASKLYPNIIKNDIKAITLKVYKRVLAQDLYKFPKDYLSGDQEGRIRAIICLQYMLNIWDITFENERDLFDFFSTSKVTKELKRFRLNSACVGLFDYPIDYLYASLPKNRTNEFWYRYYRFKMINKKEKNREKKKPQLKSKKI